MAGGLGSRFFPKSREKHPKQFLDMLGIGKSLLRLSFERALKICPIENILIATNAMYKELVKEHIPEIQDGQILVEPSRNNTAPCIAYAALKLKNSNPNACFVVAASDHLILNEEAYTKAIQKALKIASEGQYILTLGIKPTRPDTGYGYIEYGDVFSDGVHLVRRFTEKPNLPTAKEFLASQRFLWNSGIFIWSVNTILKELETHTPDLYQLLSAGEEHFNTPSEQLFINNTYPKTPNISIDYAVLEKAKSIFTLPVDIGWSDLGTWQSLYNEFKPDEYGNVGIQNEFAVVEETSNSLFSLPKGKLLIARGIDNMIVVDESDILMIYPKDKEQDIKKIVALIKEKPNGNSFL